MGILDEAIREHLELKRRRGADPSEIARLENEALGPVRREPFREPSDESPSPDQPGDGPVDHDEPGDLSQAEYEEHDEGEDEDDEEAGDDWGAAFDDDLERPRRSRSGTDAPQRAVDDGAGAESAPGRGPRLWRRSRRKSISPEDAPPTQGEAPADMPPGGDTVEYGVDEAPAGRGRGAEDPVETDHSLLEEESDALEETPEFLQDAPEHDRLWFEQRPPRDFDFDD